MIRIAIIVCLFFALPLLLSPVPAAAQGKGGKPSVVSSPRRSTALEKLLARLTAEQRSMLLMIIDGGIVSEGEAVATKGDPKALRTLIDAGWRRRELENTIEAAVASGVLRPDEVQRAKKNPRFVRDMLRIAGDGAYFGLPQSKIRSIQDAYATRGGSTGRATADRLIASEGFKEQWGITLPKGVFDAVPDPRQIVGAMADLQMAGVTSANAAAALSDPGFFQKVKSGGLDQAVLGVIFTDNPASPLFQGETAIWSRAGGAFQRIPGTGTTASGSPNRGSVSGGAKGGSKGAGGSSSQGSSGSSGSTSTFENRRSVEYDPDVWTTGGGSGSSSSGSGSTAGGSTSGGSGTGAGASSSSGGGSTSGTTGTAGGQSTSGTSGTGTTAGSSTSGSKSSGSSSSGSSSSSSSGNGSGTAGSASGGSTSGTSGSGSNSDSSHGGRKYTGSDTYKNSDGTTTVVSYFSDGSWVEGTYDSEGHLVGKTESSAAVDADLSGEDLEATYESTSEEGDDSKSDVQMSGDPADPEGYKDPMVASLISGALAELLAYQAMAQEAKAGSQTDPVRGDQAAFTHTGTALIPNRLWGLLVGDDRRGDPDRPAWTSVTGDPSAGRTKDPGNVDPADPNNR